MSTSCGEIEQFLAARGATYVSSIRLSEAGGSVVLEVPRNLLRSKSGGGFTSERQLARLRRDLESRFGVTVITSLRESQVLTDLETGLRAFLLRKYPGQVTDFFLSFVDGESANCWVAVHGNWDTTAKEAVAGVIVTFLSDARITTTQIEFVYSGPPEPTPASILRSIKTLAPARVESIRSDLMNRGFACPSESWIAARLDVARKRGLIVRSASGAFSLTSAGLDLVPHTRSGSSTDIDRMLFVAKRRKW